MFLHEVRIEETTSRTTVEEKDCRVTGDESICLDESTSGGSELVDLGRDHGEGSRVS